MNNRFLICNELPSDLYPGYVGNICMCVTNDYQLLMENT